MRFLVTVFIVIAGFFIVRGLGGAGQIPDVTSLVRGTATPSAAGTVSASQATDLLRATAVPAGSAALNGTPVASGTPSATPAGGSNAGRNTTGAATSAAGSEAAVTTTIPARTGPAASGATYEVESGDSLSTIADDLGIPPEDHAAWVTAVLQVNAMASPDILEAGQELLLPAGYSTSLRPGTAAEAATVATASTAASGDAGAASGSTASAGQRYTVAPGDTLLTIAGEAGVTAAEEDEWLADVMALNDMEDADLLAAGDVLVLPLGYTVSTTPSAAVASSSGDSSSATLAAFVYTVQPGDTLSQIAAKMGVTDEQEREWIARVLRLNDKEDADSLAAGEHLSLPAPVAGSAAAATTAPETTDGSAAAGTSPTPTASASAVPAPAESAPVASIVYVVQAGDTVPGIAAKLGIPEQARTGWVTSVVNMNQLASPETLSAGRSLVLPAISASTASAASDGG